MAEEKESKLLLGVSAQDVVLCGGFLSALAEKSAGYVSSLVKSSQQFDGAGISQILVHKEPHLDEYFAAFAYRLSITGSERRARFGERGLHWDLDATAESEWPYSAVFGMGAGRPIAELAKIHFDEHIPEGGRKQASCTDMAFDQCLSDYPDFLDKLRAEVSAIDSSGGADPLHLANLLKSVHTTLYRYGTADAGKNRNGKITAHWKRSIVEAVIAALVYCETEGIPYQSKSHSGEARNEVFGHLEKTEPFLSDQRMLSALMSIKERATVANFKEVKLKVDGNSVNQIMVLPVLLSACYQVWGKDITILIASVLLEAASRSQMTYSFILDLVRTGWQDKGINQKIESGPLEIRILKCRTAVGDSVQAAPRWHKNFNPRYQSKKHPVSVISCKYTDAVPQPHKGLQSFVSQELHGVGLIFLHHLKDGRKAIFRGAGLSQDLWQRLITRLQDEEPGLWYWVGETANFIVNGSAAKKVPMSGLFPGKLARILDQEYSNAS